MSARSLPAVAIVPFCDVLLPVVQDRGYQILEDAGDIGGNLRSSFGVDEPATVARILAWIDALPRGQHFFLTYLPIAGHHPYDAPGGLGPFVGKDEIMQYRNSVHYGDVSLGTLIDGLRARGLYENTVWIIYGDHGEAFGQHDGNYGHTFFLYDENIHVPFVIAAPGLIRSQQRARKVVSLADTAPTILDLLGIAAPPNYQGRTMLNGPQRMALFLQIIRWVFWGCVMATGNSFTKLNRARISFSIWMTTRKNS